jgi:hypothetical protein
VIKFHHFTFRVAPSFSAFATIACLCQGAGGFQHFGSSTGSEVPAGTFKSGGREKINSFTAHIFPIPSPDTDDWFGVDQPTMDIISRRPMQIGKIGAIGFDKIADRDKDLSVFLTFS